MSQLVKIENYKPETNDNACNLFSAFKPLGFRRFGDGGYCMPATYVKHVDAIKNFQVRPDDLWITTFPRSGTTWTQELVWLLENDLDFNKASEISLEKRYHFIELYASLPESFQSVLPGPDYQIADEAPSPRFIKSHLPFSLLPDNLIETAKVIYVARDPRDVAISFYHHNKLFKILDDNVSFKEYWNMFIEGYGVEWTPFFPHLKEAWRHRHHPNLLFIFYEELKKDLPSMIRRIATFLNKKPTEYQIEKLCVHLDIKNFKNNESVHPLWMRDPNFVNTKAGSFIRNGKIGGWQEQFDDEMTQQAEQWIQKNLADTDFTFPTVH